MCVHVCVWGRGEGSREEGTSGPSTASFQLKELDAIWTFSHFRLGRSSSECVKLILLAI